MRKIMLALLLGLCTLLHVYSLAEIWKERQDEALLTPKKGEYICVDCGACLHFSGSDMTIQYSDGFLETVNLDYGARLHGSDTHFVSYYSWTRWMDVITLKTVKESTYFTDKSSHLFFNKSNTRAQLEATEKVVFKGKFRHVIAQMLRIEVNMLQFSTSTK